MPCAMFGKLPSKRDFVAYNMPRPFLDHWEEWLQAAVASSRLMLGSRWQEVFLGLPIWRFWLGGDVYGTAATGALMPSVDGVGRYFPLSLCSFEPEGTRLLPPPNPALDKWLDGIEQFLLGMLDDVLDGDPGQLVASLPTAPTGPRDFLQPERGRYLAWEVESGGLASAFRSLDIINSEYLHAERSLWWTNGGGGHKARLVAVNGRMDGHFLGALMTGSLG